MPKWEAGCGVKPDKTRGVIAVAVLRLLPVAPYNSVKLAASVSHLRLGVFMLGPQWG